MMRSGFSSTLARPSVPFSARITAWPRRVRISWYSSRIIRSSSVTRILATNLSPRLWFRRPAPPFASRRCGRGASSRRCRRRGPASSDTARARRPTARSRGRRALRRDREHSVLARDGRLRPKPPPDLLVERNRTDRRRLDPPLRRVKDEGVALPATEPAVRADLLLARSRPARIWIEHAHDDEIPALGHCVDAPEALGGGRPERRQRHA